MARFPVDLTFYIRQGYKSNDATPGEQAVVTYFSNSPRSLETLNEVGVPPLPADPTQICEDEHPFPLPDPWD